LVQPFDVRATNVSCTVSTCRSRLILRRGLFLCVPRLVPHILEEGVQDVDLGLAALVTRADFLDVPIEELRQRDRARLVEIDAPTQRAIRKREENFLLRLFV